jgi:hypothetical protein
MAVFGLFPIVIVNLPGKFSGVNRVCEFLARRVVAVCNPFIAAER